MLGFLIFGFDSDEIILDDNVDPEEFDAYELEDPCHLVLEYSYFNLFFIFGLVTSKSYLLIDDYGGAVELDAEDVEEDLEENPIPFMHRFGLGLLILIAIIAGATL